MKLFLSPNSGPGVWKTIIYKLLIFNNILFYYDNKGSNPRRDHFFTLRVSLSLFCILHVDLKKISTIKDTYFFNTETDL